MYTFDRVIRFIVTAGILSVFVWLLGYLSSVLIPFALALLIAYLLNPLVNLIQKKIPNRTAAVFIALFSVLLLMVLASCLITPIVVKEAKHTSGLITQMVGNSKLAQEAAKRLPPDIWQALKEYLTSSEAGEILSSDKFQETVTKMLPGLKGFVSGTLSFFAGIMTVFVVLLYVIFLLFDFQKVRIGWKDLLPPQYRQHVVDFVHDFNEGMQRYFRAQAAVATIVGVLFAIGFEIIGMPMGILLGLFIGLLNMVPYLQMIGLVPAFALGAVHALETGQNMWLALGLVALVFAVVQIIQDALLVPKIMGKVTGLSPAIILLSLSVWGKLLGMFGLLIALPMTCLLLAYYQRLVTNKEQRQADETAETVTD